MERDSLIMNTAITAAGAAAGEWLWTDIAAMKAENRVRSLERMGDELASEARKLSAGIKQDALAQAPELLAEVRNHPSFQHQRMALSAGNILELHRTNMFSPEVGAKIQRWSDLSGWADHLNTRQGFLRLTRDIEVPLKPVDMDFIRNNAPDCASDAVRYNGKQSLLSQEVKQLMQHRDSLHRTLARDIVALGAGTAANIAIDSTLFAHEPRSMWSSGIEAVALIPLAAARISPVGKIGCMVALHLGIGAIDRTKF